MFQHKAKGAHSRQDPIDFHQMAAEGPPLGQLEKVDDENAGEQERSEDDLAEYNALLIFGERQHELSLLSMDRGCNLWAIQRKAQLERPMGRTSFSEENGGKEIFQVHYNQNRLKIQ